MIKKTLEELKERKPSQHKKIIEALRNAGIEGVSTDEISKIALRYGARLSELYEKGYKINLIPIDERHIIFKYVLLAEPIVEVKRKTGKELVMEEIRNHDNLISDIEFEQILEKTNCIISRKTSRERNN